MTTLHRPPPPSPPAGAPHRLRGATAFALVALLGVLVVGIVAAAGEDKASAAFTNSIGMRLVRIPAGSFEMGSPADEPGRLPNEGPVHRVRISESYYMGATEVTTAQFAAFVEATGRRTDAERDEAGGFGIDFETGTVRQETGISWRAPGFPGFEPGPDHPIVLISWQDAEAFCRWLSDKEGRTYRLPTEAEWEYAARSGSRHAYAGGPDPQTLQRTANLADASLRGAIPTAKWAESWDDGFAFLAPVGSFEANAFGLHDMHGNVWEWCSDWYRPHYYGRSPREDPQGPIGGDFRSIRGGGWFNPARQNRSAQRIYFDPRFRYCLLSGFRVVCEAADAP